MIKAKTDVVSKKRNYVGLPKRNKRYFFGKIAEKTNFELANALLKEAKKIAEKNNKRIYENDTYSLKEIIDLIGIEKFRKIIKENTNIDEHSKPLMNLRASQKKRSLK